MDPHPYGTLGGLSWEEVFITVYCLVDRFLVDREKHFGPLRKSLNLLHPKFTDAEVITICIVAELKAVDSWRAWYHELATTWSTFFPDLPSRTRLYQRQFDLGGVVENFRHNLLCYLGFDLDPDRIVDSAPIPLCRYIRARMNINKRFRPKLLRDYHGGVVIEVDPGFADIGYCASMKENFFGVKLHLFTTIGGLPTSWCISRASASDRPAVPQLIEQDPAALRGVPLRIWGDNGYCGPNLSEDVTAQGHQIHALPRVSSKKKTWPRELLKTVKRIRKRVETKFSEGVRFMNFARIRPATFNGLMMRVSSKITAMTLQALAPILPLLVSGQA